MEMQLPRRVFRAPWCLGALASTGVPEVRRAGIYKLEVGGTRTIPAPTRAGQIIGFVRTVAGVTAVINLPSGTQFVDGNNTATMDDLVDCMILLSVKVGTSLRWQPLMSTGVAYTSVG